MPTVKRPDFKDHLLPSLPSSLKRLHYTESILDDRFSTEVPLAPHPVVSGGTTKDLAGSTGLLQYILREHGQSFTELLVFQPLEVLPPKVPPTGSRGHGEIPASLEPRTWPNLERLCFRSRLLNPDATERQFESLLIRMADVAEACPKLREMYVFDADRAPGYSCVLRYTNCCWAAELTGRTSMQDTAWFWSPPVRRAWTRAAAVHTYRGISARAEEREPVANEDAAISEFLSTGHPLTTKLAPFYRYSICIP